MSLDNKQNEALITVSNNRLYINGTIALVIYSEELKALEAAGLITLIVVDNAQFYTLYSIQTSDAFGSDQNMEQIKKAYQKTKIFFAGN